MSARRLEVLSAEIVTLAQGLDDLLTALAPCPRHRLDVPADSPTRVTPAWPWTPKHVAEKPGDAA